MQILEDVSRRLAEAVFEAERKTGNSDLSDAVSKSLADSSQTLQEAYLASIRYLRAEHRAKALIVKAIKDHQAAASQDTPEG